MNPDKVMALRKDMTRVLRAAGWLVADADPMDGIADVSARCTEGDIGYNTVYHQVYKLESFHRLPHEPALVGMVEKLMGRKAIPLPGQEGADLVSEVHGAHHPAPPGLRPLPGKPPGHHLLAPHRRLPHRPRARSPCSPAPTR